jgi:Fe-S cluster assembly protein SufD
VEKTVTKEWLVELFGENIPAIGKNDPDAITALRKRALESFVKMGFPSTKLETWKNTDLTETLSKEYSYSTKPYYEGDIQKVFRCNIPHLDTAVIGQLNGWYVSKDVPLIRLGNGIILGSLAQAMQDYPELIEQHLGNYSNAKDNAMTALNTAFSQDGIFIYVPDDVQSPKPIQLINVIHHDKNVFLQSRNLVILGKNSKLSLVHCDDSYNHQASFSNIVTEVYLDENAYLDHYKLQNLNNNSTLVCSTYFQMEKSSKLDSHFLTLNGGLIRNESYIQFKGSHAEANVYGLYLVDRKQHIDNQVNIDHASPDCNSKTLFKGILDENASGVFAGKVLVQRDAQHTNAYQSNRNILMTDTARIDSKPFLEIYADDVKCSHGSTTGQLDAEAMFYLRQRGISEESARMLLMYAFANEIVSKIAIGPLRFRIEDMIKKRLQGELQICEQCVLHCSTPEHPMEFEIDMSKI